MTSLWERRRSRMAGWCRAAGAFSLVLFLTAGLGHRFGLVETVPLLWLLAIVGSLALFALLAGAIAFVTIWRRGRYGAGAAFAGMLFAIVALVPFGISAERAFTHPQLSDISTDIADPPELSSAARLRDASMNAVGPIAPEAAELQTESYPDVTGRRYEQAPQRIAEQIDALLEERGWPVTARHAGSEATGATTIEAVATSFLLGFKSDVAIRIEDDAGATLVDMRSASRYGRYDLGDNARRIRRFLTDLDQRVAAMAGL